MLWKGTWEISVTRICGSGHLQWVEEQRLSKHMLMITIRWRKKGRSTISLRQGINRVMRERQLEEEDLEDRSMATGYQKLSKALNFNRWIVKYHGNIAVNIRVVCIVGVHWTLLLGSIWYHWYVIHYFPLYLFICDAFGAQQIPLID